MMPRWVFLLGVGVLLVAMAFVVTDDLTASPCGATVRNARRIKPGMTARQVEALLGGAPDGAGFGEGDGGIAPMERWLWLASGRPVEWGWIGERFIIYVRFDEEGQVERVKWIASEAEQPDPLAHLRAWLGW